MSYVDRFFDRRPGQLSLQDLELMLVNRLSSFALLGFDIKLNESEEPKIVEVNGIHSGMKGFQLAEVTPAMYVPDDYAGLPPPSPDFNPCERVVQYYLSLHLGSNGLHYIVKHLEKMGLQASYLSYFISDPGHAPLDHASQPLAETLVGIEQILQDKLEVDTHFKHLRSWKPKTYATIQELLKTESPTYIIRKPEQGKRGEGIEILEADTFEGISEKPETVVESFIHSKPLLYPAQGTYHDGCMRYVVVVEDSITTGEIEITHFGGYWRLCPLPLDEYGHIDAMRANLAQGAIAQRASSQDLRLVRDAINTFVPSFYRSLVREAKERISKQQTI